MNRFVGHDFERAYRDVLENVAFSEEQKERLVSQIALNACATAANAPRDKHDSNAVQERKPQREGGPMSTRNDLLKTRRNRARTALRTAAAAALLLLAAVGIAYATGTADRVVDALRTAFGRRGVTQTAGKTDLEKLGASLKESASGDGITVSADVIAGDENLCAVVYTFARDDGASFASYDDGTPALGLLQESFSANGSGKVTGTHSRWIDSDPEDCAVQLIEIYALDARETDEGIVQVSFEVTFSGLVEPDSETRSEHMVAEGPWTLSIDGTYRNSSIELEGGVSVALREGSGTITSASVSPVGARIVLEASDETWSEDPDGAWDAMAWTPVRVVLDDGTEFFATDVGSPQHATEEARSQACARTLVFDRVVSADEIASIVVGDAELAAPQ